MNKRKVILLGFTIPNEDAMFYFQLDPSPAIQTHKFAWSLARSLAVNNDVFLVSSAPIQNYPLVKKIFINGGKFEEDSLRGYLIPFINVILLKQFFRLFFGFFVLMYLCLFQKPKFILVHGLHTPYLILINIFKLFSIKTAIILTDPAGVELNTDSLLSKYLKRIDTFIVRFFIKRADFLIALAPSLIKKYNKDSINLVFPGILNSIFDHKLNSYKKIIIKNNTFKIVYAGGLHEIYGIKNLVNAILSFNPDINIKMIFFGRGDQLEYIKKCSISDSRVEYGGFLNNDELIPQLLEADLLINPRPTLLDLANLSFPSKLIEYLATGVPVLTTRISSIPKDLKDFFYYIDDESEFGIQESIIAVMAVNHKERALKASLAKQFIQENLSENAIGQKIENTITRLLSH